MTHFPHFLWKQRLLLPAWEVQTGIKSWFGDDICPSQTMEITAMTAVVANGLKLTEVPAKR